MTSVSVKHNSTNIAFDTIPLKPKGAIVASSHNGNGGFSVTADQRNKLKSKLKSSHESKDNKSKCTSEAGAGFTPCCNTGGRYSKSLSFIDWLRVTTSDGDDFNNFIFEALRLLADINIDVTRETSGMIGYSIRDSIVYGKGDDAAKIGNIATGNHTNDGGLFELNGSGCSLLNNHYPDTWLSLHALMVEFNLKITRSDIALDFQADYALEKGYSVPALTRMAFSDGLMAKGTQKGEQSLSSNNIGQWGELMCEGITPFNYDPLIHAQAGLTTYLGSRSGADYFRIYEKGKQLDSALPEGDKERAYFRFEHEMKHDSGKRPIPLDVMINPDAYFCEGRSGARALLDEMLEYYKLDDVDELHRENKRKQKVRLLTKKREWMRETAGRTFRTLVDTLPDDERERLLDNPLVAYLVRPEGLKDFVNDLDLKGYNVLDDLILSNLVKLNPMPDSGRVPLKIEGAQGSFKAIREPVQVGALATT